MRFYRQVKTQDADFLSEAIIPMAHCYEMLNNSAEFIAYVNECLAIYSRVSLILLLAEYIAKYENSVAAIDIIAEYLRYNPSIRGLQRLIELQLLQETGRNRDNLLILKDITASMLKNKPIYRCNQCGFSAKSLHWLCPSCKTWNSVKPIHGLEGD